MLFKRASRLRTAVEAFFGILRGRSIVANCTFVNTTLYIQPDDHFEFRGYAETSDTDIPWNA